MKLVLISFFLLVISHAADAQILGARRAEELNLAYETVTGISRFSARVKAFYAEVKLTLPANPTIQSVTSNSVIASTGLASYYCELMVEKDMTLPANQRWAHSQVDLFKDISLWNKGEITNQIKEYGLVLWSVEPDKVEMEILQNIFELFSSQRTDYKTLMTLVGVCASMLSSPRLIIY